MENSGKQNPESGFKSPPEHIVRIYSDSKWLQFKQLRHESFYVKNITHNCSHFCDAPSSLSVVTTTKSHN